MNSDVKLNPFFAQMRLSEFKMMSQNSFNFLQKSTRTHYSLISDKIIHIFIVHLRIVKTENDEDVFVNCYCVVLFLPKVGHFVLMYYVAVFLFLFCTFTLYKMTETELK